MKSVRLDNILSDLLKASVFNHLDATDPQIWWTHILKFKSQLYIFMYKGVDAVKNIISI